VWHAPKPVNAGLPEGVELVLKEVARMSVTDNNLQGNDAKLVGEFCGEKKDDGVQNKEEQLLQSTRTKPILQAPLVQKSERAGNAENKMVQ